MGNIITNWAKSQTVGHGGQKAVLLCLADSAKDYERGAVTLTQPQIAEIIEFDVRSVKRWIKELDGKLIQATKSKKEDGTNNPNQYQILCPPEIFEKPSDTESPSEASLVTDSHHQTGENGENQPDIVTESHLEQSDSVSPSTVLEEEEFLEEINTQESDDSFVADKPQTAKVKKAKYDRRTKDARSSHVAIQTIRGLMNQYPDKGLWDKIIKRFGEHFNKDKLRECRIEWLERGYNPKAVIWLNWYFDGIPERNGANQNGSNHTGNSNNGKTARTVDTNRGYRREDSNDTLSRIRKRQQPKV